MNTITTTATATSIAGWGGGVSTWSFGFSGDLGKCPGCGYAYQTACSGAGPHNFEACAAYHRGFADGKAAGRLKESVAAGGGDAPRCPDCKGTGVAGSGHAAGWMGGSGPCARCEGTGEWRR